MCQHYAKLRWRTVIAKMRNIFSCLCFLLIWLPTTEQKKKTVWNICLTSMMDCRYNLNVSCTKAPGGQCDELVANVPNEMFSRIFDNTCENKILDGFDLLCQTMKRVSIKQKLEIAQCLARSTINQICWTNGTGHDCLEHIKDCNKSGKYYCTQMKKYLGLCHALGTYEGYVHAYEVHCRNRTESLRCKAITDSFKRQIELVYPICAKLCDVGHELCISCIKEFRNNISDVGNSTANLSAKLVQKYCANNTEHDVCNPIKKTQRPVQSSSTTTTTTSKPRSPPSTKQATSHRIAPITVKTPAPEIEEVEEGNNTVTYIIVAVVVALIVLVLGIIIYLWIEIRHRRNYQASAEPLGARSTTMSMDSRNGQKNGRKRKQKAQKKVKNKKRKKNKTKISKRSRAVSRAGSCTLSDDGTVLRKLTSEATVTHKASEQGSLEKKPKQGKKLRKDKVKEKESENGSTNLDESRVNESRNTKNDEGTEVQYERTKGEGKRQDKTLTTKREEGTEEYELTKGEGTRANKPVTTKRYDVEVENEVSKGEEKQAKSRNTSMEKETENATSQEEKRGTNAKNKIERSVTRDATENDK